MGICLILHIVDRLFSVVEFCVGKPMNRKQEMLNAAIDNGEVLSIIYNGGSKPGSKREIIPIQSVKGGALELDVILQKP